MWIIITNNSNLYTTFKNKKMENVDYYNEQ